jgi:hypothetical protein
MGEFEQVVKVLGALLGLATGVVGLVVLLRESGDAGIAALLKKSNLTEGEKAKAKAMLVRTRRLLLTAFVLGGLGLAATGWLVWRQSGYSLKALLEQEDPGTFPGSRKDYSVARVLADRAELQDQTNMAETLSATTTDFSMLAITASGFQRDYWDHVVAGIKRGVKFRFILCDYGETNSCLESFMRAVDEPLAGARADLAQLHEKVLALQAMIDKDRATYPGSIDVRWNPLPPLYTLWVRDRPTPLLRPTSQAHLSLNIYGPKAKVPAFRTGQLAPGLTKGLADEFEAAWSKCLATPTDR